MSNKQTNDNCKHWLTLSCPERNNESMLKFEPKDPSIKHDFSDHDIKIIEKLCAKCTKFTPIKH